MMKSLKYISLIAGITFILLFITSCSNVSYIATIDNEKMPVGPYAFYAQYTRDNYQSNLTYYGVTDFTSALTEQADSTGTKLYAHIIQEAKKKLYTTCFDRKKIQ
jgi:hypothetical protein